MTTRVTANSLSSISVLLITINKTLAPSHSGRPLCYEILEMSSSIEEFSDIDSDDGFNEDMEALRRACQLTGKTPIDRQLQLSSTTVTAASGVASAGGSSEADSDGEGEDDLQLVRSIQQRFAVPMDTEDEPLKMKPLCTLPPDWSDSDDCVDDYETLRAIQRRFTAYNDGICCPLFLLIESRRLIYLFLLSCV